jgi:FkbM family methyltransferase
MMRADSPDVSMWKVIINEQNYTPKSGDRVLDLGAHHGFFSMYCSARGALVRAFEPDPDNFIQLEQKIAIAKNMDAPPFTAIQAAVWSESGEKLLWRDPADSGANSMLRAMSDFSIMVKTVSLSEALCGNRWDCVKVDVEGAEAQIFLTAKAESYRQIAYLTMELHNDVLTQEQNRALVMRMRKEFPRVVETKQYFEGLPTEFACKVFCWGSV